MAIFFLIMIFIGSFFVFSYRVDNSTGLATKQQQVVIKKGLGAQEIADLLQEKEIISNKWYFLYYIWSNDLKGKMVAGEYLITPKLKIAEIVDILIDGKIKPSYVKITFPEGWTMMDMAEKLNENGLPGDEFLMIVKNPTSEIIAQFDFLKNDLAEFSLEGYLFPDTYFFSPQETAEGIIIKILKNFDNKFSQELRDLIIKQKKNFFQVITMASIIESEVRIDDDRKIVSGIFWNRIGIDMALQSDATLAYALGGKKKVQHDAKDLDFDSPYNTYKFKGLPPGPISNPGISSIEAAIDPTKTNYIYFLNNPQTGKTFFATTFEEHIRNKIENGL